MKSLRWNERSTGARHGRESGPLAPKISGLVGRGVPRRNIIAFHGGGGGAGTTTLAGETAVYFSAAGYSTAAVDLNLLRGSLHYKLDVPAYQDTYTITDLVPALEDFDERILENALSKSPLGPSILPAPNSCEDAVKVTHSHIEKLIQVLSGRFQKVIIDTSPYMDDINRSLFKLCELVVLAITPEIGCISGARKFLDELDCCSHGAPEVFIVLNKSIKGSDPFTLEDIQSFLGKTVSSVIPEDSPTCRQLSCRGRQIIRSRTGVGQSFESAVRHLL
ncbi:MAG: hypothetical protein JXA49_07345 [Actinobacteria bacterium]|nr:hypothetical protein [Actinomycetota bacterium]